MGGLIEIIFMFFVTLTFSEAVSFKCPACDYRWSDTYSDYALRMLNAKGPANGTCLVGTVKYIHKGKDFCLKNDACCCLPIHPAVNLTTMTPCPDNWGIGKYQLISDYYVKFASAHSDAPENGICRDGTYKFIFAKALTGLSHDICACVPNNKAFE